MRSFIFLMALCLSGCGTQGDRVTAWEVPQGAISGTSPSTSQPSSAKVSEPKLYCGSLYVPKSPPGGIQVAGNDEVIVESSEGKFALMSDSEEVNRILTSIRLSTSIVVGCVGAEEAPLQGFENWYLKVTAIQLEN